MLQATAPHFIPTKILVPLDFSSSSDAALETASDLAEHFHAELYLLNVIPMPPMGTKTVSFLESEYLHRAEGNAERQLAMCEAALLSKGIKASSNIEIGDDMAGSIMQAIEREHVDMVVISTHGISDWRPTIFGSIAEKVVKACNVRYCSFAPSSQSQLRNPEFLKTNGGARRCNLPQAVQSILNSRNQTRHTFASGGSAIPPGGRKSGRARRATPILLSAIP